MRSPFPLSLRTKAIALPKREKTRSPPFRLKQVKDIVTRKMGKSLALLGRLPEQLNVLSAIFCDKLGE
jgi:hypothetical protein